MKNILVILMIFIAGLISVNAQTPTPTPVEKNSNEFYVGYQFVRQNPDVRNTNFRFDNTTDSNGVNVSATHYGQSNVGITGELAANFDGGRQDSSLVTAMVGVTAKARNYKNFQPFVRGLVGVGRIRAANEQLNATRFKDFSDTGLAFALGTGVDYKVGKRVSFRILQVDYLQTRTFGSPQHNIRVGSGITF